MRRVLTALAVGLALFGTTACSPSAKWLNPGETEPANPADPSKVNITGIKDGATDVSTSTEITYTKSDTRDTSVSLVDEGGKTIAGAPRADGSSWVPAAQLDYETKYTATVTASKADGTKGEAKVTFTTMKKPTNLVDVTSYIGDDQVVGVGMPVIITFGVRVPEDQRAAIQRRLFVTSDPPQDGIWQWMASDFHTPGTEVHYRPREYWKAGTKINVRVATGGLAWGVADWYGGHDITLRFSVGDAVLIDVDNATKKLTVTQNGQVTRTMPVSLGRPSFPSSSGTMVIVEKHESELFTSASIDVPVGSPGGYSTQVKWVMKLTSKGEYIHAAPWSVKDQGKRNVSHGCVNVSADNAQWLQTLVPIGTPVTVRGTEVHVAWGNGVTDWDRLWDDYVKGSAIPYQATLSATPSGAGG